MGLRERKRGREIWGYDCGQPWESGDGEEIFGDKLDFDCVWLSLKLYL